MKGNRKMIKAISMLALVCMIATAFPMACVMAEETTVAVIPVEVVANAEGEGMTVSGKLDGTNAAAAVLVAVYDGTVLKDVQLATNDPETGFSAVTTKNGSHKLYVWESMTTLKPLCGVTTISDAGVTATDMANGVKVSWTAVDGATSYDLYREGTLVAEDLTTTEYAEKYFDYIESYLGEDASYFPNHTFETNPLKESVTANVDHTYTVVANNNVILKSDDGKADVIGKMAYISFQPVNSTQWLSNLYSAYGNYGRTNANGLTVYGTHAEIQNTVKNESWQGANVYLKRTLTTDANGVKVTYSSATSPSPSVAAANSTLNNLYFVNKFELGRQDLYTGSFIGGARSVAYKKDSEGYLLDVNGARVTDVENAVIDEEMYNTYGGDVYVNGSTVYKNVYDEIKVAEPKLSINLFKEEIDKTGTQYTILVTGKIQHANETWDGVRMMNPSGSVVNAGFANPWVVNKGIAFHVTGKSMNSWTGSQGGPCGGKANTFRWDTDGNMALHPDLSTNTYNLEVSAKSIDRWFLLHSLAVARTSEFIK